MVALACRCARGPAALAGFPAALALATADLRGPPLHSHLQPRVSGGLPDAWTNYGMAQAVRRPLDCREDNLPG